METPPPPTSATFNMSRITKPTLLSILNRFPFDSLVISDHFASTERDEDTPGFINVLIAALQVTLLESAPANISPRRLMEPSGHLTFQLAPTQISASMSELEIAEAGDGQSIPFMRGAHELDDEETKPIIGSTEAALKLRRAALRNMADFPLHRISNLVPAEERPSSSNLPPLPDLPFDSKAKPMSPARRALMKDIIEEARHTLYCNPYKVTLAEGA
jgi:hypothetical protein